MTFLINSMNFRVPKTANGISNKNTLCGSLLALITGNKYADIILLLPVIVIVIYGKHN